MAKLHLDIISFGVILIIVAVLIAAWIMGAVPAENVIPFILLSGGGWVVITAGIKASGQNGGGALSTFGWGMLLIVLGGSWYMISLGMNPLYTVVFVLILIGALAVAVALRSIRK